MANQATHNDTTFKVGDGIKVHQKIRESEEKSRVQVFEGIVIAIKASGTPTFTVRKIGAGGIGVEKIFPLMSPTVKKIEVEKQGRARKAKLYYLRKRVGKKATKVREKRAEVAPKKAK